MSLLEVSFVLSNDFHGHPSNYFLTDDSYESYVLSLQLGVTTYAKHLDKAKCGLGCIPDRQILKEARADLERVLAVRPCLRTHLEMGQVGSKLPCS